MHGVSISSVSTKYWYLHEAEVAMCKFQSTWQGTWPNEAIGRIVVSDKNKAAIHSAVLCC